MKLPNITLRRRYAAWIAKDGTDVQSEGKCGLEQIACFVCADCWSHVLNDDGFGFQLFLAEEGTAEEKTMWAE